MLLVSVIAIKIVFFTGSGIYTDPESGQIIKPNIFQNDDYAVYASYLVVSDNQKAFMHEKWFTKIKNDISQHDLLVQWSTYAPRITRIFTQNWYYGWSLFGKLATSISKTHKDAFYLTILFWPVLVGLKYISLLVFLLIFRRPIVVPMLYAILLLDFIVPTLENPSGIYAWEFFTIGFVLWVFNEKRNIICYLIAYSLLIYASLTSAEFAPIVTSIAGVHLLLVGVNLKSDNLGIQFKKLLAWNDEKFSWIASTILLLTIPLAVIYFVLNMVTYPMEPSSIHLIGGNLTYQPWMFSMMSVHLMYLLNLQLLAFLVAVEFTSNKIRSLEADYKALTLKLLVTLSLVAAFLLVLSHPILPFAIAEQVYRLAPEVIATSLVYLVYVIWKYECVRKSFIKNYRVCLMAGVLIISFILIRDFNSFRPAIYHAFNDTDYPRFIDENQRKRYYLAENPKHVLTYFIDNLYNHAPLVLNINTKKYNKENVVRELFGNN